MTNLFLYNQGSGNAYLIIFLMIILLLLSPAIISCIIGLILRKKKPKTAKILFIIAGVYLLIGLGVCGATSIFW